jgi:ferredoxin
MHTLELGVITAGFLLMASVVISVLFVGRVFCSWGCHMLALQDAAAWILARLKIRTSPLRSRLLPWIAIGAAGYMFLWPQVARLLVGTWPGLAEWIGARPEFRLRVLGDQDGWASFMTSDFTRNLPGPGVALLTFVVCGLVATWLLGSRSFCRLICPYGAVFSQADRFASRRIVLTGTRVDCGLCTRVCDSGISVYEEIRRDGAVTTGGCLKDFDCVHVCPTQGLALAHGKAPGFGARGVKRRSGFSWAEEILMAIVFLAALVSLRGLYRVIPFLLALTLACLLAVGLAYGTRLAFSPEVGFQSWTLKRNRHFRPAGWAFSAAILLAGLATLHSGVVRWHQWRDDTAWQIVRADGSRDAARRGMHHLMQRERLGWFPAAELEQRRATYARTLGQLALAQSALERLVAHEPRARVDLAELLASRGDLAGAERQLVLALDEQIPETAAAAHYGLGVLYATSERHDLAEKHLRLAQRLDPRDPQILNNLGFLLASTGRPREAEQWLRAAIAAAPEWDLPCVNLLALYETDGRDSAPLATICSVGR